MLAVAIATEEDDLICDLAQYYGIHDYREFGVLHIATLVMGLPEDSRIVRSQTGISFDTDTRLLALIIDLMQRYMWLKGGNRSTEPTSLYEKMMNIQKEEFGFTTAEEFERERQAIIDKTKGD